MTSVKYYVSPKNRSERHKGIDIRRKATVLAVSLITIVILTSSFSFAGLSVNHSPSNSSGFQSVGSSFLPPVSTNPSANSTSLNPNPYEIYQKEPAPMGIADYGVGSYGSPYSYGTSSFLGIANVQNLTTVSGNSDSSSNSLSLQLNVNLEFTSGNALYVYWIQNVMLLNSSSNYASFVDNIWNFSSQNANVYSSAVIGNGSIAYGGSLYFYYDTASANLHGNDIFLKTHYQVKLMVNVSVSGRGYPVVNFLYNDGFGWIVYDTATFVVAKHLTSQPAFIVDGFQYEPTGYTFYDAEFVIGGPGAGNQVSLAMANADLQLEYYNNNNFQMITNAYNFGSNTAEGVNNVTVLGEFYPMNGSLFSSIATGQGSLGPIYLAYQISIVNISAPISSGVLYVNNTAYSFKNWSVNVTLGPSTGSNSKGYYLFQIYNTENSLIWSKEIHLRQGEYLPLNIKTYQVTFEENSFPKGDLWYLNLSNGESFSTTNSTIICNLPDGNYSYTSAAENSYYLTSGTFQIKDQSLVIDLQFTPVKLRTYTISFDESGLLPGTTWSVTLNGKITSSVGSSLTFLVPNGTYLYSVGNVSGFLPQPSNGNIIVDGSNISIPLIFKELFQITFSEKGLPAGTVWYVNLSSGESYSSNVTTLKFSKINGTYTYIISTGNKDYHAPGGSFTIKGSSIQEPINFALFTYVVSITETGLPADTRWYVNLSDGQSFSSVTSEISFQESNGTYSYTVTASNDIYTSTNHSGLFIIINGSPFNSNVSFVMVTYSLEFNQSGLPEGITWSVTLNGVKETSTNSKVFNESNGTYSFSVAGVSGFTSSDYSGTVTVNGAPVTKHISWSVATYILTISINGIPSGSHWSVTINGTSFMGKQVNTTLSSISDKIVLYLSNGSYSYSLLLPVGYHSKDSVGNLKVVGTPISLNIAANQPLHYYYIWLIIVISIGIISAIGGTFILLRRKKSLLSREDRFVNQKETKDDGKTDQDTSFTGEIFQKEDQPEKI